MTARLLIVALLLPACAVKRHAEHQADTAAAATVASASEASSSAEADTSASSREAERETEHTERGPVDIEETTRRFTPPPAGAPPDAKPQIESETTRRERHGPVVTDRVRERELEAELVDVRRQLEETRARLVATLQARQAERDATRLESEPELPDLPWRAVLVVCGVLAAILSWRRWLYPALRRAVGWET